MRPPTLPHRAGLRWLSAGFTLTELVVVAAILVLVSSASFPAVVRFYEEQKLRQAAIELQSHLLRGRTLAQRLQSNCTMAISSGVSNTAVQVTGSGSCANTSLSALNISQLISIRDLCISNDASNSATRCATPATITFLPLGVLAGAPQQLVLSGTTSTAQACLDLNLTLIRVGFRPNGSSTCTYSRS